MSNAEELKVKGNKAFASSNYDEAEKFYTLAIDETGGNAIFYTNRSAARYQLGKMEESISDADKAISMDPTWTKAYYRKAVALERLSDLSSCYETWSLAVKNCESTEWLKKQFQAITVTWGKHFKSVPVKSANDLLSRYKLLKDSRERLSTMAHFWNLSSQEERLSHFQFFLSMIGGVGRAADANSNIDPAMLLALPMDNYIDLPQSHIQSWCDYFQQLPAEEKTIILKGMWDTLSTTEQNTVVTDLKSFIFGALHNAAVIPTAPDIE